MLHADRPSYCRDSGIAASWRVSAGDGAQCAPFRRIYRWNPIFLSQTQYPPASFPIAWFLWTPSEHLWWIILTCLSKSSITYFPPFVIHLCLTRCSILHNYIIMWQSDGQTDKLTLCLSKFKSDIDSDTYKKIKKKVLPSWMRVDLKFFSIEKKL